MANYYVSKIPQSGGCHEVHASTCLLLPLPEERLALGCHDTFQEAVLYARLNFRTAVECKRCCVAGQLPQSE